MNLSNSHRGQRGLSLVELLVGLALGLLLTAAGVTLLSSQWREHRAATVELRLMQELRSSADLIGRDLRRAGHWGAAGASANPYAAFAPASAASDAASFAYSRDTVENHVLDSHEQFGLRLRNGAIELQLGAGNWQAMTDASTLTVTRFSLTPHQQEMPLLSQCAKACPAGSSCPAPTLQLRSLTLELTARAVADPQVERHLRSDIRMRNDLVLGACPA
jgi:prepilin peptidase dependent protein B